MKVRIIKMGKYCKGLILDLPENEALEQIENEFAIDASEMVKNESQTKKKK